MIEVINGRHRPSYKWLISSNGIPRMLEVFSIRRVVQMIDLEICA